MDMDRSSYELVTIDTKLPALRQRTQSISICMRIATAEVHANECTKVCVVEHHKQERKEDDVRVEWGRTLSSHTSRSVLMISRAACWRE